MKLKEATTMYKNVGHWTTTYESLSLCTTVLTVALQEVIYWLKPQPLAHKQENLVLM